MGTVEDAVRAEIARVAKQQCRAICEPLTSGVRDLKQQVAHLEAEVRALQRDRGLKPTAATQLNLGEVTDDEVRRARLSPDAIKRLRAGLSVTQAQLAALIGVTGPAVAQWEGGTSEPRGGNRAALVALRKLGRREVASMLSSAGMVSHGVPKPTRH